jgi:hypothetical protein
MNCVVCSVHVLGLIGYFVLKAYEIVKKRLSLLSPHLLP